MLKGAVRSKCTSGRIDILAFNFHTKKFVIVELKKDSDKNIRSQASDYKDFIESNFSEVYLSATEDHDIELPKSKFMIKDSIELVLIAKDFSDPDIDKAKKSSGEITLIKYRWFDEGLFFIQYLNNEPRNLNGKDNFEQDKNVKTQSTIQEEFFKPVIDSMGKIFKIENRDDVIAHGRLLKNGKLVVLQGSMISLNMAKMFQTSCPKDFTLRKQLTNDHRIIANRKFMKDHEFNSKKRSSQSDNRWQY